MSDDDGVDDHPSDDALDPERFERTEAHDPALRPLESGATELLPTVGSEHRRTTTRSVEDEPRPPVPRGWWIALVAVLLVVALIVAAILLAGDDDEETSPTSPTTLEATTTTLAPVAPPPVVTEAPTTTPETTAPPAPAPAIVTFTGPASVACTAPTDIELSWETADATSVTIGRDDQVPVEVDPSGSQLVEFPCDGAAHRYVLTASNDAGQVTQQQLTVEQS